MNTLLLIVALFGQLYGESPEERAARITARSNEEISRQQRWDASSARHDAVMKDFLNPPSRQRFYLQPPAAPSPPIQSHYTMGIHNSDWPGILLTVGIAVAAFIVYCIKLIKAPPKGSVRQRPDPALPD